MSIKQAIKDRADTYITTYYGIAPQRASRPFAILNRIGGSYGYDLGGAEDYSRERWQLDLYGTDDEALEAIRNNVKNALHGYGPVTWSGVTVQMCLVTDARDLTELETEGAEAGLCRHQLELVVKYTEPAGS